MEFGDFPACHEEFIEGAARLRGGAKALDIWRMVPWNCLELRKLTEVDWWLWVVSHCFDLD